MLLTTLMVSSVSFGAEQKSLIKCMCSINGDPVHSIARDNSKKPKEYPQRAKVNKFTARWDISDPKYKPVSFTDPSVLQNDRTLNPKGWADPQDIKKLKSKGPGYRQIVSLMGPIKYSNEGLPLNPCGRTGIQERGLLGKWGPNLAADPIITRYSPKTGTLQMLAIKRKDNGQWAIPGGMVDDGDDVGRTLEKEFKEEAGLDLKMTGATTVYQGYVDDPRNTDNAWMETVARHMHLSADHPVAKMEPVAGDDAAKAQWKDLTPQFIDSLYASHPLFVKAAIEGISLTEDQTPPSPIRTK